MLKNVKTRIVTTTVVVTKMLSDAAAHSKKEFFKASNGVNFRLKWKPEFVNKNPVPSILQNCNILEGDATTSVSWQTVKNWCRLPNGVHGAAAQITFKESIEGHNLPQADLDCIGENLQLDCNPRFFTDWSTGEQFGFVIVMMAAAVLLCACVMLLAYGGYALYNYSMDKRRSWFNINDHSTYGAVEVRTEDPVETPKHGLG